MSCVWVSELPLGVLLLEGDVCCVPPPQCFGSLRAGVPFRQSAASRPTPARRPCLPAVPCVTQLVAADPAHSPLLPSFRPRPRVASPGPFGAVDSASLRGPAPRLPAVGDWPPSGRTPSRLPAAPSHPRSPNPRDPNRRPGDTRDAAPLCLPPPAVPSVTGRLYGVTLSGTRLVGPWYVGS